MVSVGVALYVVVGWLVHFCLFGVFLVGYDEVGCFSEVFFWAGYFGACAVGGYFSCYKSGYSV